MRLMLILALGFSGAATNAEALTRVCHPSSPFLIEVEQRARASAARELVVSSQNRLNEGGLPIQSARQAALLDLIADRATTLYTQAFDSRFNLAQAVRESGAILLPCDGVANQRCIQVVTGRIARRTMQTSADE